MIFKDWLGILEYELLQGSLNLEAIDVIYDSRKARQNTVFVCMKGTNTDSHDFIPDVLKLGVRILVVERQVEVPPDITVLLVKNGRNALAELSAARFDYPAKKMVSIGITGTKGKTTTTYMLKAILEAAGKKVGLIGTNGAIIGSETFRTRNTTPESYELQEYFSKMVEAGCQYMIMEVSSQGIMMHRVDGIFFDYGIFMNISADHIGPNEHKSFEEYLYYKSQLLKRCRVGLVNWDDEFAEKIIEEAQCQVYTFGIGQAADFKVDEIKYVADKDFVGLDFQVKGNYDIELRVNIPGMFNVYNALAAVGVSSFFKLPKERIIHALEHIRVDGRMEIVYASEKFTVIVDYAHNAVSMESLLKTLRQYRPKRLVCVFGCGGNRAKDRRYTMGEIGGRLADLSIITADNSRFEKVEDIIADIKSGMKKTDGSYLEIPDRREAITYSITHAEPGDMIAIIGKGHEDYQEIEGVRYPFLDRTVVEEAVSVCQRERELYIAGLEDKIDGEYNS